MRVAVHQIRPVFMDVHANLEQVISKTHLITQMQFMDKVNQFIVIGTPRIVRIVPGNDQFHLLIMKLMNQPDGRLYSLAPDNAADLKQKQILMSAMTLQIFTVFPVERKLR